VLLMHEVLHYASGARAPIVMANVNRTVASPWAFWPDQTDSLAQRDTGWIQFYVESAQETLDTVLHAFRLAEQVQLPAMVCLDAFYVSHALEPVQVPAQETVDAYLPPYAPEHRLDTALGSSWGNVVSQDMYYRHRQAIEEAMAQALPLAQAADREWAELTGRSWGVVERYRCDGARAVIVTMGSMCGTAREAVDAMRAAGEAVGLVKLRLFRPFPAQALRVALAGVPDIVVLDRNHSPGLGGILHQELRAALYGVDAPPRIHGLLAGVGGVNVSPEAMAGMVRSAIAAAPRAESNWVR
jgi:pyruvate/2-oxoacid:ferredoxin oxidoreductase alpha subunit